MRRPPSSSVATPPLLRDNSGNSGNSGNWMVIVEPRDYSPTDFEGFDPDAVG